MNGSFKLHLPGWPEVVGEEATPVKCGLTFIFVDYAIHYNTCRHVNSTDSGVDGYRKSYKNNAKIGLDINRLRYQGIQAEQSQQNTKYASQYACNQQSPR